jgi:hypothetical protein
LTFCFDPMGMVNGGAMKRGTSPEAGFPKGPTRTIIVEPLERPQVSPAPSSPEPVPEQPDRSPPEPSPTREPDREPVAPREPEKEPVET